MGKVEEVKKWMRQAEADLKSAEDSLKTGHFEWACFQSQQSAEKALKAYLYGLGLTSIITHSVRVLVKECAKRKKSFSDLNDAALSRQLLHSYTLPQRTGWRDGSG